MATDENIAYLMLIVSKELESIATRDDIKCKFSYLEGMKRGFQLKQEEEQKKENLEKIFKTEKFDQEVNEYKKKIIITFEDGSYKTLFHTKEDTTLLQVISEIQNEFNKCAKNGFVFYKDIIIATKYIKFIEVFDIESNN
jgi:hypothetical protein